MSRAISHEERANALALGVEVLFSLAELFVLAVRSIWYDCENGKCRPVGLTLAYDWPPLGRPRATPQRACCRERGP
jgi:hypothetical protein